MDIDKLESQGGSASDSRGLIGQIARSLAVSSQALSLDVLDTPKLEIAQLTARLDPDGVDPAGASYRFGAAQALAAVLNGLYEQVLSNSTTELLLKSQRARILTAIAASSGAAQKQLADDLGVKESNLSRYLQELAKAGLIEPATVRGSRGKAWSLSPWGVRTFFSVVQGPVAADIPADELASGMRGARLRDSALRVDAGVDSQTISKDEVYSRLEAALRRKSDEPLRLTTLYTGDLRQHARPWRLHERVFKEGLIERPVEWVFLESDETAQWLPGLLADAAGNSNLTVWTRLRSGEAMPTVQVLDREGLLYPLPPNDSGLVQDREAALAAWESVKDDAEIRLQDGKVAGVGV